MKKLFTICIAVMASIFMSQAETAGVTLKDAMKSNDGVRLTTSPLKPHNPNAPRLLKPTGVSRFHQMRVASRTVTGMMRAPKKINAIGDNIYGYLTYAESDTREPGLFEFEDGSQRQLWVDTFAEEVGMMLTTLVYDDNVLKGYMIDLQWGMFLYGVYYVEYDFETGQNLKFEKYDMANGATYMQSMAIDSKSGILYGFGYYNNSLSFFSAPVDDPFGYSFISTPEAMCVSMCYNAIDDKIYGVTTDSRFVSIDRETGKFTTVMELNGIKLSGYVTGLVYDPASKLYYWNINRSNDTSALATINADTRELNVYEELFDNEEYLGLYTTDEEIQSGAPGRPKAGEADFYKNNLIGFVSFILPSEYADGTPLEGEIEYKTYLEKELYSVGKGEAGGVIRANFAVKQGLHTFGMRAAVNGVEGPMVSVKAYIGNDTPLAPANVTIDAENVTWDAVGAEGVHGGYVSVKDLTYDVYINGEFIANTSLTTQRTDIDLSESLSTYNATVIAKSNGLESTPGLSNTIIEGSAFKLPAYFEPTPEQFGISTIIDGNEDGDSWKLAENADGYYINSGYNRNLPLDDYYFLPPVVINEPDKFYTFSMEAAIGIPAYSDEFVEVIICNEPNRNGVVAEIIPEFTPTGNFEKVSGNFRIRQAGTYYIAIHATSDPDQYGVYCRNFAIEDNNITLESPEPVGQIVMTPGQNGKLEATASFKMPTSTLSGKEISSDTELTATVSAANSATVKGKPGEEVSVDVETLQGDNVVTVFVSDATLNSPTAEANVYTGVHIPATIIDLTYEISSDNRSMILSWPAVTEGEDGGYVNTENLVYDICVPNVSIFGTYLDVLESDVKETTYTYTPDTQENVDLTVVARNVAGQSPGCVIVSAIVGPAYELPLYDDFEEIWDGFQVTPWVYYGFDGKSVPEVTLTSTSTLSSDYASAETYSLIINGEAGSAGLLGIPYVTTVGVESATITLDVCGDFFLPKTTILAETPDIEREPIGEIIQDENGFKQVSLEIPAKFMNKERLNLYIQFEFSSGDEVLAIESVGIYSGATKVESLTDKNVKIYGGDDHIIVKGVNNADITIYDVAGMVAVKAAKVSSEARFQLKDGIYIVEVGNKKTKVIVK